MRKSLLTLIALVMGSVMMMAQNRVITGTVLDKESKEALMQTTVQLLKSDSSYVTGAVTDADGKFSLKAPKNGKYILKMTNIGYKIYEKNITVADNKDIALGKVNLAVDAVLLKEVVANGVAAKVTVKEDTFVYNASAYRTAEGSVIEELVKKIPGAQVDDDGNITINGKSVKKIKVDGKEFMSGDTKTALKNLPTSIVDKIRAYDEKSDLARVTGIDDGEESTVLDFGIKPGMNKGYMFNFDGSYGNHDRYAERLMGMYTQDGLRFMGFGGANNTNDMGFPGGGRRGFGGNRNGLNASKDGAFNVNYDKDKLNFDFGLMWRHSDGDAFSKSSSENFVATTGSFSNSINRNYSRGNSVSFGGRLEWKPDTLTNIMFRPSYSYSTNDGLSSSLSGTYNEDPYLYTIDPLENDKINDVLDANGERINVNGRTNRSLSYSKSKNGNGMLQFNRKLNNLGRNITLRVDGGFSEGESNSLSAADVHLYQVQTAAGLDSTYQTNRYNTAPTKNWNYKLQATYSEPIARATFLQFRYQYQYSYSKSDRDTYDFSRLGNMTDQEMVYRGWMDFLNRNNVNPLGDYLDKDLSRFSEYSTYTHVAEVMLRFIREKYNFNVGVQVQPQKTHYVQDYQGVSADTTRTVTNFTPTLEFRYKFSKVSQLRINYRANTSQPSISQLLDITDNSDPLNISKGNPGLKPAFTNNFRLFYNGYRQERMQSWMAHMNFSTTRNSISNMVTYDEKTGGRTTRPENINGKWNMGGGFMFNTSIDTLGNWNINTMTDINYNHDVGYLTLQNAVGPQKNSTNNTSIGERLSFSYRNDWLEVEPNGSFTYTHARNKLQSNSDLDTWQYSYGLNVNITAPWGTSLTTNINENCRRGYNDASMNTNEFIWNAQISQSFLRGRPLTVSLQFYDILKNQSNFSRAISAYSRNDTWYNSINSYAMLKVTYRINAFGGKEARRAQREGGRGGFDGPPGGGPRGGRNGQRGGGFGGYHGGFGGHF